MRRIGQHLTYRAVVTRGRLGGAPRIGPGWPDDRRRIPGDPAADLNQGERTLLLFAQGRSDGRR
jgi:hypothetical protein